MRSFSGFKCLRMERTLTENGKWSTDAVAGVVSTFAVELLHLPKYNRRNEK